MPMDRQLINYLPKVLRDVVEYKIIFNISEQPEFELAWERVDKALDDQFIVTATEYGIGEWEKVLKIVPKATDSIEDRRFRVLTRMQEQLPYTLRAIRMKLEALCGADGYTLTLHNDAHELTIKVALTAKSNFDDVAAMLRRTIPANMIIDLDLVYNPHITLAQYTHAHLAAFTQDLLRNEVLA